MGVTQPPVAADHDATRPLAEICTGVARLLRDRWGRGPGNCHAHWAGRDVIVVLLEDGRTPGEDAVWQAAGAELVLAGRRAVREHLEPELREIARRATGREVLAVLGATRVEPDLAAEVFVLAPERPGATSAAARPTAEDRIEAARAARARAVANVDSSRALQAQSLQVARSVEERRTTRPEA